MSNVGTAFIEIKPMLRNLERDLRRTIRDAERRAIRLGVEVERNAIRDTERAIKQLDGTTVNAAVDIADADLDSVEDQITGLDGTVINAAVEAEQGSLTEVESAISNLQGTTISVNVEASGIADIEAAISNLSDTLTAATKNSDGLGQGLNNSEVAAAGLASKLTPRNLGIAGGVASIATFKGAVSDFDKGIREVASLQIPDFGIDEATDLMLDFQQETGKAITDNIPALYNALSAGIPPDNALSFLVDSQKLASAGVADLQPTIGLLTGAINAYGDELGSTERASNALFAAVQSGVTTLPELGARLGQVTPLAAELGISFEELNAAVATSTQVSGNTARTVTGLRGLLGELGTSTSKAGAAFQEITDESFADFIDSGGTLAEALQLMQEEADDAGIGLNELFGSIEAGGVALQLARDDGQAFADTIKNVNEIVEEGSAVANAFAINEGSLDEQEGTLKTTFEALALEIGTGLLPLFNQILATALPIVQEITGGIRALFFAFQEGGDSVTSSGFAGFIESFGLAFRNIFDTIAPVVSNLAAQLAPVFSQVAEAIGTVFFNLVESGILESLVGQFGLFAGILLPLAPVIADLATTFAEDLLPPILALLEFLSPLVGVLAGFTGAVLAVASVVRVVTVAMRIWAGVQAVLNFVLAANPIVLIGVAIAGLVAGIILAYRNSETFRQILSDLFDVIQSVGEFIADVFITAWDQIVNVFTTIGQFLAEVFIPVLRTLQDILIVMATITLIPLLLGLRALSEIVSLVSNILTSVGVPAFNAVVGALKSFGDFVKNVITPIIELFAGLIKSQFDFILSIIETVVDRVIAAFNTLRAPFAAVANFILGRVNAIKNVIGSIIGFIAGLVGRALSVGKDFGSAILDGIRGVFSAAGGFAKSVVNAILRFVNQQVIGRINRLVEFSIAGFTINPPDIPSIPLLADGGIFDQATQAIIGEAGSEAVIPLTRPQRALELMRESGLDRLLLSSLAADQGSAPVRRGSDRPTQNTSTSTTANTFNIFTREGQDEELIGASLARRIGALT